MNLIQIYAPIADKSDEEIEVFLINSKLYYDINLVYEDLNAKFCNIATICVTGALGLGERNERGEPTGVLCKKPACSQRYIFQAAFTTSTNVIRNQIDYNYYD